MPFGFGGGHFVHKQTRSAQRANLGRQLGRRNSTEEQKAYLIGKLYEAEKMAQGGTGANRHTVEQTGPKGRSVKNATRKRIADQYGVGEKVVRNAASFAKGLDAADKVSPGFKDAVLTGS